MSNTIHAKLVIIGSGPAGYTAAIYAARAMLEPVLIQGIQPGGQLTITTDVENYPGFADVIQGPWLMEQMEKQAAHVGTRLVADHVSAGRSVAAGRSALTCDCGDIYLADDAGHRHRRPGALARSSGGAEIPGLRRFGLRHLRRLLLQGREVVVVGGGNTAVEEALFLTNFATKVTVVHRRDAFRAERILQERLFRNPKIEVIWNSVVEDIGGTENPRKVTAVAAAQRQDRRAHRDPGRRRLHRHRPLAGDRLFAGQLEMKPSGYIKTAPHSTATSVPGVFAAGDVTDEVYRQAVTAAGMGCMAALEAERFLAAHESTASQPNRAARERDHDWRSSRAADAQVPRMHDRGIRIRDSIDHGLGQAQGFPRRRRSRQFHPCGRAARPVAIGGVAPGQRAGAGTLGFAVPPPCPRPHPHRAGRTALPDRPRRLHEARIGARQADRQPRAAERRPEDHHHGRASACIG